MMSKTIQLSVLVISCLISLTACKKGEDDPFLSLKTRDARITGTWQLVEQNDSKTTIETIGGLTENVTELTNFNGNELTISGQLWNGSAYVDSAYSIDYSHEMVIKKDGSFSETKTINSFAIPLLGDWWWLDSKKNKSRISFSGISRSYNIKRLTNKELVLEQNDLQSYALENGDYYESSISSELFFEKLK